ncbi:kinetochore protein NDC80 homolog [Styela clava]
MSRKTKSSFGRDSLQSRSSITGASASKLPRSTPLPHSSRKVLPPHSSIKSSSKRSSYFGGSDHHVVKDTRPLNDKPYMRRCINEIVNFIKDHGYPHPITAKLMSPPTNKEYFRIVEFVYGLASPGYKMIVRPEEEMFKLLSDHNYPFSVSKSTLSNVGAMSAWPNALGALDWLVDLVKYLKSLEDSEIELDEICFAGDKKQKMHHEYLQATYIAFMRGENAPFTEIDNALKDQIAEKNKGMVAEVADLKLKLKHQHVEIEEQMKQKLQETNMEEKYLTNQKLKKDLEVYFEQLDKYCESVQNKCTAMQQKIEEMENQATQMEMANKEIQSVVVGQDLSVEDVQHMNIELNQLDGSVKSMETRCKQLQDQYYEKQIEQSKMIDKINSQIVEYTEACRELELIPETAANANGIDYSLSTDRSKIDKNVDNLVAVIRPKLIAMKGSFLKDVGRLQQERHHNATIIEQLKEQIMDQKRSKENVSQQLEKLKDEEEQQKIDFDKAEEEQRKDLERLKEDIQSLKTMNSLSLEDVKAQVKIEREKLRTTELRNEREEDEMDESLIRISEMCLSQKSKIDEIVKTFYSDIRKTNEKFLPLFDDLRQKNESLKAKVESLAAQFKEIINK